MNKEEFDFFLHGLIKEDVFTTEEYAISRIYLHRRKIGCLCTVTENAMDIETFSVDILLLGFTLGLFLYGLCAWRLNHFKRRGIPYVPGYPLVGNLGPALRGRVTMIDMSVVLYNQLEGHRFGGIFNFTSSTILVRDPELMKHIFVKDFDHFVDRSFSIPEDADEFFGRSLLSLSGRRWRDMRATLSPAFTSSKMKNMLVLVSQCGDQLVDYLQAQCREKSEHGVLSLEMRELWTRYSIDVIATAGFGVKCDSFLEPDNEFYEMGKLILDFSGLQGFVFLGYTVAPRLMKFLRLPFTRPRVAKFLRGLVAETLSTREREGIVRADMIHLLMQARKGELGEADASQHKGRAMGSALTDQDICAQVWNFFFAGTETTTTLLSFGAVFLATHPEVQARAREEVDAVLEEAGGRLTYEALQQLKYLEMVVSETLRLYPPVSQVDRKCLKRYAVPGTDLYLEPEDSVSVLVYALHRDPRYFPDPLAFDPQRFSEENMTPHTYLPFGMGPRACIGMRLAMMETKVAFAMLLSRFDLRVVDKTRVDMKLSTETLEGGFWVGISPREAATEHKP